MQIKDLPSSNTFASTDVLAKDASGGTTEKINGSDLASSIKTLGSLLGTSDVVNNLTSGETRPVSSGAVYNALSANYPTITAASNSITSFGHNSFVKDGIMYVRGFFKAGNLADQTTLLEISGYTAKKRSEGIIITKYYNTIEPVFVAENSNKILLNSTRTNAGDNWTFIMIDFLIN